MNADSDHPEEMNERPVVDETTADLLLAGHAPPTPAADPGIRAVVEFVGQLQATVNHPPAPVSPALAAVLRDGLPTPPVIVPDEAPASRWPARWRRIVPGVAAALGLAVTGVTGAAAANLLPDGPQRIMAAVVKALTPFEVPSPEPASITPAPGHNRPADRVPGGSPVQPMQPGGDAPTGGTAGGDPARGSAPGGVAPSPPPAATSPATGGAIAPDGSGSVAPSTTVPLQTGGTVPSVPGAGVPPGTTPQLTRPSVPSTPSTLVPTPTVPPTTLPRLPLP